MVTAYGSVKSQKVLLLRLRLNTKKGNQVQYVKFRSICIFLLLFICNSHQLQGNTHNDYLRYGRHILREGYRIYNISRAIHYA